MKNSNSRGIIRGILLMALLLLIASPCMAGNATADAESNAVAAQEANSSASNGDQVIDIAGDKTVFEASKPVDLNQGRDFGTSVNVPLPGMIGPPSAVGSSHAVRTMEDIVLYKEWFTDGAIENNTYNAKGEFDLVNGNVPSAKPTSQDGKTRWIKIIVLREGKYTNPNGPIHFRGFSDGWSDAIKTKMFNVVSAAAKEAMDNGCNVLHLKMQGAVLDAFSSAWGIGVMHTQSQIFSADMDNTSTSGGGTGYAQSRGKARTLPWVQGYGIYDPYLVYPKLVTPADFE